MDFLRWISFALALCSFFLFSFRYAFYDHHDIMDNGYEYEYEYGHEFLLALRFGFWIWILDLGFAEIKYQLD